MKFQNARTETQQDLQMAHKRPFLFLFSLHTPHAVMG